MRSFRLSVGLRWAGAAAGAALLADQLSKWVILEHLQASPRIIELTPFFNLTLGFNRGVSFGLLSSGSPLGPWLLSAFALIVVGVLSVWAARTRSRVEAVALGAVVGGALGNVMDRVRQGAVTDFLDFHAFGWHWPTFNLADVGITGGVGLLLLHGWRQGRRETAAGRTQGVAS